MHDNPQGPTPEGATPEGATPMPIPLKRLLAIATAGFEIERCRKQLVQGILQMATTEPDPAAALAAILTLARTIRPSEATMETILEEKLYFQKNIKEVMRNTEAVRRHRARKKMGLIGPAEAPKNEAEEADAAMRKMMDDIEAEFIGETGGAAGPSIHDTLDWSPGLGLGRAGGTKPPPKDSE